MGIKIVTDSTSEISQAEAKELAIAVVPLKTIFGEDVYRDGIDLSPEAFYDKLAQAKESPTTSQPAPFDFEQTFRQAQAAGDQIVVICMAASLSGTWQSALVAREKCGGDIWIIDSATATVGLQLLVRLAISLREAGKTAAEIARIIEEEKERVCLFAAIDTLEYLHKSGRLSGAYTLAGTLFQVKPLISLQKGELKVIGKSRGLKKAQAELFQLVNAAGGIDHSKPFGIGYTGGYEHLSQFEQECRQRFAGHEPIIGSVGSVVGTHAGPGAVAITFFKRN
jgi:DegV family protein with EDD domain